MFLETQGRSREKGPYCKSQLESVRAGGEGRGVAAPAHSHIYPHVPWMRHRVSERAAMFLATVRVCMDEGNRFAMSLTELRHERQREGVGGEEEGKERERREEEEVEEREVGKEDEKEASFQFRIQRGHVLHYPENIKRGIQTSEVVPSWSERSCNQSKYLNSGSTNISSEIPLWLSELRIGHCLYEDAGLISGLTQWVKDPVLLQAAAWVPEAPRIWYCHGCGAGPSCSSGPGTSICPRFSRKKKRRRKHQYLLKGSKLL